MEVKVYNDIYSDLYKIEETYPVDYEMLYNKRVHIDNIEGDTIYYVSKSYMIDKPNEVLKKPVKKKQVKSDEPTKVVITTEVPFKSMEECVSQKRSEKYYMSKSDILDYIKSNGFDKELSKGYRNFTKDKICEELFAKKLLSKK
jgi:hypothetical protein